jgi:hypothetical protein
LNTHFGPQAAIAHLGNASSLSGVGAAQKFKHYIMFIPIAKGLSQSRHLLRHLKEFCPNSKLLALKTDLTVGVPDCDRMQGLANTWKQFPASLIIDSSALLQLWQSNSSSALLPEHRGSHMQVTNG